MWLKGYSIFKDWRDLRGSSGVWEWDIYSYFISISWFGVWEGHKDIPASNYLFLCLVDPSILKIRKCYFDCSLSSQIRIFAKLPGWNSLFPTCWRTDELLWCKSLHSGINFAPSGCNLRFASERIVDLGSERLFQSLIFKKEPKVNSWNDLWLDSQKFIVGKGGEILNQLIFWCNQSGIS